MKVVLFCGGFGMRMRGSSTDAPKPLQMVGPYPLLWHVMRYYAHFGHTEFILCLGYGAHQIKDFFLRRAETGPDDFRLVGGRVEPLSAPELGSWDITFVDTGIDSGIGDRLRKVERFLDGEEMFFANYADVLSDVDLDGLVHRFADQPEMVVSLLAVPPQSSFHVLDLSGAAGAPRDSSADAALPVQGITAVSEMPLWENGGYLVLRREIFDWLEEGKDLVGDACVRLAAEGRLLAQQHRGFWKPADTFKERAELDDMWARGDRPWARWDGAPCTR